jgi:DNA-binding NarL/FixJ family response regulator
VIDNQLPDGLGIDLCRVLARRAPAVALVLHTADPTTPHLVDQALAIGRVHVVGKQTRATALLNVLDALAASPVD